MYKNTYIRSKQKHHENRKHVTNLVITSVITLILLLTVMIIETNTIF